MAWQTLMTGCITGLRLIIYLVGVRGKTAQQRPVDTRAERDIGGCRACRGSSECFYRKHPFPITYTLLPSYCVHSLRLISLPVSSLKFALTAFNSLWSPKRAINFVLDSFRMCHILVYITSFSFMSILSNVLIWKLILQQIKVEVLPGAEDTSVTCSPEGGGGRCTQDHREIQPLQIVVKVKKTNKELRQKLRS